MTGGPPSETAIAELTFRQREAFERLGEGLPDRQAQLDELLRSFCETAARLQPRRSTSEIHHEALEIASDLATSASPYDEPRTLLVLRDRARELRRGMVWAGEDTSALDGAVLSTMPTGSPTAWVEAVHGTEEHLVIFDRGMVQLVHAYAVAIARTAPQSSASIASPAELAHEITCLLEAKPSPGDELLHAIVSYATGRLPSGSTRTGPAHVSLVSALDTAAELFLLAHEVAHIELRHLDADREDRDTTEPWRDELYADARAAWLAAAALQQTELPGSLSHLAFCASTAALTCFVHLESALKVLQDGHEGPLSGTPTHPPSGERLEWVEGYIDHELADRTDGTGAQVRRARAMMHVHYDLLWGYLRGRLVSLHKEGVRPHAKWATLLKAPQETQGTEHP